MNLSKIVVLIANSRHDFKQGMYMHCAQCGKDHQSPDEFCVACGASLSVRQATIPEESEDTPDRAELYRAVIGPKNQEAYLKSFERFDREGKAGASWHWPALFVTSGWLLYRKLWVPALIYILGLPAALFVLRMAAVALGFNRDLVGAFLGFAYFALTLLVLPMYAKALYYRACRNRIEVLRSTSMDPQKRLGDLARRGGTSVAGLVAAVVFGALPAVSMVSAVAMPAYQDYMMRARFVEAFVYGNAAKVALSEYYDENGRWPNFMYETNITMPRPRTVMTAFVQHDGVLQLRLIESPYDDHLVALLFAPRVTRESDVVWTCAGWNIDDRFLPESCKALHRRGHPGRDISSELLAE